MKVGYARVSTGEQEDALIQQIARLKKAGVSKIYSDTKSGKSQARSQYNTMLEACKRGDITEVVITRLDRLSRSLVATGKAIALFQNHNIKLTILDAPIEDLSNPFSIFSINQMGALAQFESDLLQNRIKHGYNHLRESGKAPPKCPFGYVRQNEQFIPDMNLGKDGLTNWAIARSIVDYFLENKAPIRRTIIYIYDTFGVRFSTTGLHLWLKNPTIRGHIRYNAKNNANKPDKWDLRLNTHQALITESEYREIELIMDLNKSKWGRNTQSDRTPSILSGLVFCGCCGGKCYVRGSTSRFFCKKRNMYGDSYCSNRTLTPLQTVVDAVDNELVKHAIALRDFALSDREEKEPPELVELKTNLETLQKLASSKIIDDAVARLKMEIAQFKIDKRDLHLVDDFISSFSDIRILKLMDGEYKRQLYRKFIRSVVLLNGEVKSVSVIDF